MTTYGHIKTMSSVNVAKLKANLSEYLRAVRKGREVTVLDRETPIARIVPFDVPEEPLPTRKPLGDLRDLKLPGPVLKPVDSLAALLEERQAGR